MLYQTVEGGGGGAATLHTTNRVKNANAGIGAWRAMWATSRRRVFIAGEILVKKNILKFYAQKGRFCKSPRPACCPVWRVPLHPLVRSPPKAQKTPLCALKCRREGIVPPRLTAVQRTPLAAPNSLFSAVCARWRRAALHLLHAYVPAPIVGLGQWRRRINLQPVVKVGIT